MEYREVIFNNRAEVFDFIKGLNEKSISPLEWAQRDNLYLYSCIFPDITIDCLFVYGKTITPTQIENMSKIGIFANLKTYGSSKRFKGLLNIKGETILDTSYDELSLFYQTEDSVFIKTKKKGLFGIVSYRHLSNKVDVIIPPKYEDIFDAGEFTFGFVENGLAGLISLSGKLITEAKYKVSSAYNHFFDGKALVCKDSKFAVAHYINHYGEFVAWEEDCQDNVFSGNGTGYYPYGELPDALDAYEGDESNYWNTD
ncbi:MAG: WG repeat-containing protein [Alistipes sp.]|nr:WG repeat-containing protein [Alistipes sp.]